MGHRKRSSRAGSFTWQYCRSHRKPFLGKSERDCPNCKKSDGEFGRLLEADREFADRRRQVAEDIAKAIAVPAAAVGQKPIPPMKKRKKKTRRFPL